MHAVLFDIDGTLLQSASVDDALYRKSVRVILGDVELRQSLDDYDPVTDSAILSQILADNDIPPEPDPTDDIKQRFVRYLEEFISDNGPFVETPGASDYLSALCESDRHAVAIATGGWGDSARLKLASAGLHRADVPLATSDDAHNRAEIMRIALSRLRGTFETITYFGDGPWDRAASAQLGWRFVPVGRELGGLETFRDMQVP